MADTDNRTRLVVAEPTGEAAVGAAPARDRQPARA